MSAHTSGTWRVGSRKNSVVRVAKNGKTGMIAHFPFTHSKHGGATLASPAESEANARICAAAPDLLEALKLLDAAFCADDYGTPEGRAQGRAALIAARAAIAKATTGATNV